MTHAIATANLQKTYREGLLFRKHQHALKGLSLEVAQGEIFGLLGGNGAGKTTFIKILLGIIRKSSGDATLLGFPAGDRRSRRLVGYLPENLRMPRHLTGLTALEFYGALSNVPSSVIRAKRQSLLEMVGIAPRAKDPIRTYSKGMLQRLGLAQALLHDPQLLILDEPTDGLDPQARSQVRSLMLDLKKQGKTIFLNSHILQEVELVCDRVAILHKGELKRLGRVDELTHTLSQGPQSIQVTMELLTTEAKMRELFTEASLSGLRTLSPTMVQWVTKVSTQAELDQCIDTLRQQQISIASISRQKVSLESVFLDVVQNFSQP